VGWRDGRHRTTWNEEGVANVRLPRAPGKGPRLVKTPIPWNAIDRIDGREGRDPQVSSVPCLRGAAEQHDGAAAVLEKQFAFVGV
jgi:hypothetical protein